MERIREVPFELQGRMRQYWRILLSYGDFKHAKLVAEHILSNRLHEKSSEESYVTLPALNCSMIIAYARPFSGNSGRGPKAIPDLPGRFLRLLTLEEKQVHETALYDRNKFFAHTDTEAANLEPVLLQISEDREMVVPLVNWRMAPLELAPTRFLLSAATKLFEATLLEREKMEPELTPYFRKATLQDLYGNKNGNDS